MMTLAHLADDRCSPERIIVSNIQIRAFVVLIWSPGIAFRAVFSLCTSSRARVTMTLRPTVGRRLSSALGRRTVSWTHAPHAMPARA